MPFKKIDAIKEVRELCENDSESTQIINDFNTEYELLQSIIKIRKDLGLTQGDVAEKSGLTQQMVSRIEMMSNTPTLTNFLRYIDALGLEIVIAKRN